MKVPDTFIHTIDSLLSNELDSGVVVFLYDILVYSYMLKEYFMLLKKVLVHLYQYIPYCKLKKCSFLYNITMFFGFNITLKGI